MSAPPRDPSSAAPALDVRDELAYDRTHLANERTFAAWLRTGLAVAAGGIAVAHLVPEPSRDSLIALALGGAFVLLGVGIMAYGARQFARLDERLAREGPRSTSASIRSIYVLTAVLGVLLLAVLLFLWTHQGRAVIRRGDAATTSAVPLRRDDVHIAAGPRQGATIMRDDMRDDTAGRLVWITRAYGINPAQILLIFHGNDGHVEITMAGGVTKKVSDRELTEEGRALLLPPAFEEHLSGLDAPAG